MAFRTTRTGEVGMAFSATALAAALGAAISMAPSGCFLSTTGTGPSSGGAATTTSSGGSGGGTTSSSSSSSSSSSGTVECTSPAMCGTDTQCVTWACTGGVCISTKVAKGDPCLGQPGVCEGGGMCVPCTKDGSTVFGCPSGEDCVGGLCTGCANGTLDSNETDIDCGGACKPCDEGMDCKIGADCLSGVCDTSVTPAVCVTCDDGVKSGSETDVDCGGACPPCGPAKACKVTADCAAGACSDGVCCATDCSAQCASCVMPGHEGTCTNVPKGINGAPACGAGMICDGAGQCGGNTLAIVGALCTVSTDCYNNNCAAHACRLLPGEPCTDSIECDTGRCANNVCATCTVDTECASGKCDTATSRCKLPSGSFCSVKGDCLIDNCIPGGYCLTGNGMCMIDNDCANHRCVGGACTSCNADNECASGKCHPTNHYCYAPSGAPCQNNVDCASGSCTPAPVFKKCQ